MYAALRQFLFNKTSTLKLKFILRFTENPKARRIQFKHEIRITIYEQAERIKAPAHAFYTNT